MHPRWRHLPLLVLLVAGCDEGPPMPGPKQQAEGYYIKGNTEYLQGHFDAALKSFDTMKTLSPEDPRLPAALGEVYLAMGQMHDALTQFELALQKDPKRSTNWSRVGFIHSQLGHTEEAESALRKALALYPRDANALELLGDIALKRGDKDSAVKHFLLAADASSDVNKPALVLRATELLTANGHHPEALAVLTEWTGPKGVQAPELFTARGDEQVRAGQLPAAAESYREAARRSPRDPSLWELVGEIHTRLDKPGDALADYRESLRVKDRAIVHVAIARILLHRGERAAAEEELGHALETVSGSDVRELTELSSLLSTLGRKPDALRILTHLSAEPQHAQDAALQRQTAALARELKDEAVVREACARLAVDGGTPPKCP